VSSSESERIVPYTFVPIQTEAILWGGWFLGTFKSRRGKPRLYHGVLLYLAMPRTAMYYKSGMPGRETNPNFMNGVPELLILRLLQQEEMYGYEIVQAIRSGTDAVIAVGEGVVYPVLHGLERDGALKSRRKTVNGRSRIYYSVTRAGSRRLVDLSKDWSNLTGAIQKMLKGGQHAQAIA
jgi:PadR family transcriptional regulator PadR